MFPVDQSAHVLVPLVNAPHEQSAIEFAVTAVPDGTVSVLNVVTPIDVPLSEGRVLPVTGERREDARDHASSLVDAVTQDGDSSVKITVVEGRPARAVVEWADDRDVDHIVLGTRDWSVLPSVLFGRRMSTVIDDLASVPVTTVSTSSSPRGIVS